ncbi:MAG: 16S rRNA (cytidine(1402)-2'-O)-methyltransferase [Desulfobacterales bacterium]|nr:16S rRNA (cytidine(1402)-2'-O)-methyltransferase [Desulfobacterales bacterium]MCP4160285.1 16S rRNA (cytidine(1402)-2'-O)-methyltransferase [Deltaproteobacteria bacterium]
MHSNSHTDKKGSLYITATPIGNMGDITLRSLETLRKVDIIAAEDTRHTGKLLAHYEIKSKLIAIHEHNEMKISSKIISEINSGKSVAIVSDAGTPCVSDPGYVLVREALKSDIEVVPIPGVSAVITAVSASGLPSDSFIFQGFPPKKNGKRKELLKSLKDEKRTLIFYNSPSRIAAFIEELLSIFGEREAVLSREMTKIYEEFIRGNFSEILQKLSLKSKIKGECTLIIEGGKEETISLTELKKYVKQEVVNSDSGTLQLAKEIAKKFNIPKKKIYDLILEIKN